MLSNAKGESMHVLLNAGTRSSLTVIERRLDIYHATYGSWLKNDISNPT